MSPRCVDLMQHNTEALFTSCGPLSSPFIVILSPFRSFESCPLCFPSLTKQGGWCWDGREDLIRSRVQTWILSLCVSSIPWAVGLIHSAWSRRGDIWRLEKWTPGGRRETGRKTRPSRKLKYARSIGKPLINCQRRFRIVCWCRRTLAIVLLKSCKQIHGWVKERAREKLEERECCYWITGDGC